MISKYEPPKHAIPKIKKKSVDPSALGELKQLGKNSKRDD